MYLVIDTTTDMFTVAAGSGEKVYASKVVEAKRHSDRLIPSIKEIIKKAGISFSDIKAVGVCSGPGSFTGIRIGLSCAVTIAQVLQIPVYPLSRLDIAGRRINFPVVKAFGKKYYFAEYDSSGRRKSNYGIIDEEEKEKLKGVEAEVQPGFFLKETDNFFNSNKDGDWREIEPVYLMETNYRAKA